MNLIETHWLSISLIAAAIILSLAGYAGHLVYKLHQQKVRVKSVNAARLKDITESLDVIARATLQQQCGISEAVIRIRGLLDALSVQELNFQQLLPHSAQFYLKIQHHPILSARKKLNKLQLLKLDAEREELEAQWEQRILKELEQFIVVLRQKS
ncbi:DUF2489 domain-containing protein [Planctobacterium marinum]|uniref:DUF2489 domain-containing protein n=1 Tax=Planctobacterium marinum TaxID=1631968 RepID=A0AA48KPX5_9ALTE|nr:hypothetical protein MACH26_00080 [Planctobacterium marinum]